MNSQSSLEPRTVVEREHQRGGCLCPKAICLHRAASFFFYFRFSRVSREVQRLVHEIQAFDPPYRNVPNPGRDLGYIPSFSWQYVGRNMRPLMESLCWILAAMTAGLHDATPALHPHRGWNGSPRQVQAPRRAHEPAMGHKEATSHTSSVTMKPSPSTSGHGHDGDVKKITVGVVMERRSNHSPHRLIQGVLEGLDRSRFRVVVFAHGADSDDTYPPAGTAIMEAADEVLIMPWHRFVTGMSDPFVERQVVAKEKVRTVLVAPPQYLMKSFFPVEQPVVDCLGV